MLSLKLHHPRLFAVALLLFAGALMARQAFAEPGSEIVHVPLQESNPSIAPISGPPAAGDLGLAEEVLAAHPSVGGKGPLTMSEAKVWTQGKSRTLVASVSARDGFDGEGPWVTAICDGQYVTEFKAPVIAGRLYFVIDTTKRKVVELGPPDYPWDLSSISDVTVTDVSTDRVVGHYTSGTEFVNSKPLCDGMTSSGR
jgi:hypothetical protein